MTPDWWAQRGPLAQALRPLSWLYRGLAALHRASSRRAALPVPVLVVGNWLAGGAGKTPTLLAVLALLREWDLPVGVISRGHGRRTRGVRLASDASTAADIGDEPLLIARRAQVPLAVGERRVDAARALLVAHPEIRLLVSDDGLQHHELPRALQVLVFDRRGLGNGLLLPAGPLRQDRAHDATPQLLLYTDGVQSTALPGFLAHRVLGEAIPLAAWWRGEQQGTRLAELPGDWLACAGIATPTAFFDALAAAGRPVRGVPMPDHTDFSTLPWPADAAVLVTEKDAVKLDPARPGCAQVRVVPLHLRTDTDFHAALRAALPL